MYKNCFFVLKFQRTKVGKIDLECFGWSKCLRHLSHEVPSDVQLQCAGDLPTVGLVLGAYSEMTPGGPSNITLTNSAEKYNKYLGNSLYEMLKTSGPIPEKNDVRLLFGLDKRFPVVGIVGLGEECLGYNDVEQRDENKERIREAAGVCSRLIQKTAKVDSIYIESFGHAESAAEGAAMALWSYQEHKKLDKRDFIPKIYLFDNCDHTGWQIGLHKAAAQNLARQLCDAPANMLTPRAFAEHSVRLLNTSGINIEMKIKSWLKMVGMESLLALGKGSCEEPLLVEATYYGCDPNICPIILIGKGMTFDSGGLCLKKPKRMESMRNDMAGAACIIATLRAAAALQLPINIRALIPMCENMMGPRAMKPGDIIKTLRGKTVKMFSTDTEGRLSMMDMLTYASTYKPKFILDIGTLSKAMKYSMGTTACGVWSNNDKLWEQLRIASVHTGDRVWRYPLWNHYKRMVQWCDTADLKETDSHLGGPNLTAALLHQFLCGGDWMHMDIHSVTRSDGKENPYLSKGMSGRPTRTLIEFLAQFACINEETPSKCNEQLCKFPTACTTC